MFERLTKLGQAPRGTGRAPRSGLLARSQSRFVRGFLFRGIARSHYLHFGYKSRDLARSRNRRKAFLSWGLLNESVRGARATFGHLCVLRFAMAMRQKCIRGSGNDERSMKRKRRTVRVGGSECAQAQAHQHFDGCRERQYRSTGSR